MFMITNLTGFGADNSSSPVMSAGVDLNGTDEYLSKTLSGSPTKRNTWTMDLWFSQPTAGDGAFFGAGSVNFDWSYLIMSGGTGDLLLQNLSGGAGSNAGSYGGGTDELLSTDALYNVTVHVDTDASAGNRAKCWVNGAAINFPMSVDFTSGQLPNFNTSIAHYLGRRTDGNYKALKLYRVQFVDGLALDHSSFGQTDGASWVAKPQYAGTWGVNGFCLDFANSADLGNDVSGNGNDWALTNVDSGDAVAAVNLVAAGSIS